MDSPQPAGRSRSSTTREQIVRAAQRAFAEGGYGAVSINDLVTAAGVSRNQLFHYYSSKEAVALAALELSASQWQGDVAQLALMHSQPRERLLFTLERIRVLDAASGWPALRLLGGLALGRQQLPQQLATALDRSQEEVMDYLRAIFKEMKRSGQISGHFRARPLAGLVLASLLGGALLSAGDSEDLLESLGALIAP